MIHGFLSGGGVPLEGDTMPLDVQASAALSPRRHIHGRPRTQVRWRSAARVGRLRFWSGSRIPLPLGRRDGAIGGETPWACRPGLHERA